MPKLRKPDPTPSNRLREIIYQLFDIVKEERSFLLLIVILFVVAGLIYPFPAIAMWFGFILAAYSAVSNDSIQTIGTFIASNADRKWYVLWLYIGTIFLVTVLVGWIKNDGDVSYGRLQALEPDGSLSYPQPDTFNF